MKLAGVASRWPPAPLPRRASLALAPGSGGGCWVTGWVVLVVAIVVVGLWVCGGLGGGLGCARG